MIYTVSKITLVVVLSSALYPPSRPAPKAVMVLSCLLLRARYTGKHLVGVALCLGGLALTILSDLQGRQPRSAYPQPVKGDILCIVGAALYAGANVMQEDFVKNHDRGSCDGGRGGVGSRLDSSTSTLLYWCTCMCMLFGSERFPPEGTSSFERLGVPPKRDGNWTKTALNHLLDPLRFLEIASEMSPAVCKDV